VLPYIRRALGPAQLQAERVRLELTRPIGPAVFGTASSSSRIRSKIRWGGLEPPPRGPQSRALPGELRTWGRSEEESSRRRPEANLLGHLRHPRPVSTRVPAIRPSLRNGAPGRVRSDDLPRTRRVLCQSELQERGLQGRDLSRRRPEAYPRRATYEAAARPLSYPALCHTAEGIRTLMGK
jgi:hypothetical protein